MGEISFGSFVTSGCQYCNGSPGWWLLFTARLGPNALGTEGK